MLSVIEAVVVDNQRVNHERISRPITNLLSLSEAEINWTGFDDPHAFLEHANKNDFSLLACDLSLGDGANGLDLCNRIKKKFPWIFIVGVTSNNALSARRITESQPSIDEFITKDELSTPADRSELSFRLKQNWRFNRYLGQVDVPGDIPDMYVGSKAKKQIGRIVSEITYNTGAEPFESVNSVMLRGLSGGRSGSAVFSVNPKIGTGNTRFVNAVLKVSPIGHARKEHENYVRFVRWVLPFGWRPELLGYAECGTLGGICYSFIADGEAPLATLTDSLDNGGERVVKYVCDQILGKENAAWYGEKLTKRVTDGSLYERYRKKYFTDAQFRESDEEFQRIVLSEGIGSISDNGGLRLGDMSIDLATRTLFNNDEDAFFESVQHGDMNSNNVLITAGDNPEIKFIDFQDTGYFHVWCDFVTMYASVLIGWPEISGETPLSSVGTDAECVPPELRSLCSTIRTHAFSNFMREEQKNFDFALAMFSLRLLRLELQDFQRRRLAAVIFGSLLRLESGGGEIS
jgi:hypothetical protein